MQQNECGSHRWSAFLPYSRPKRLATIRFPTGLGNMTVIVWLESLAVEICNVSDYRGFLAKTALLPPGDCAMQRSPLGGWDGLAGERQSGWAGQRGVAADAEDDRVHDRPWHHDRIARAKRCPGNRRGNAPARATRRPAGRLPPEPRRCAPAHRQDQRHQPRAQHRGAGRRLRLGPHLWYLRGAFTNPLSPHRHALFAQQRPARAGPLRRRDGFG
jgi:hypothetical protein